MLLHMLLAAGSAPRVMDMNGCGPLHYVLKVTGVRPAARPELCYQLLLNYGAPRVYPPQFHKVGLRGVCVCVLREVCVQVGVCVCVV